MGDRTDHSLAGTGDLCLTAAPLPHSCSEASECVLTAERSHPSLRKQVHLFQQRISIGIFTAKRLRMCTCIVTWIPRATKR